MTHSTNNAVDNNLEYDLCDQIACKNSMAFSLFRKYIMYRLFIHVSIEAKGTVS